MLLLCLAALLGTSSVGAQTDVADADGETLVARQRFAEGVRHYDNRDYEKARLAFLQAYLLKEHPAVLLNLAQSELRAGRYAEAAGNFAKYIRENPTAKALDHARASLDEARMHATELHVTINAGDSSIAIDGQEVGVSPLSGPLYLAPGQRRIEARNGTFSTSRTLQAIAGQRVYVALELEGATGPAAPGAPSGPSTAVSAGLATEVPESQMEREVPALDDPRSRNFFDWLGDSPPAIATLTLGGLSLATSAALAGFASSHYSSAEDARDQISEALVRHSNEGSLTGTADACGEGGLANGVGPIDPALTEDQLARLVAGYAAACTRFSDRSDSGDRLKTLSLVSLGVGLAATMGTIVWYFAETGSRERASVAARRGPRVTPLLGVNSGGLRLDVQF